MTDLIGSAVSALRQGGVIAYPTEYCFGLGCDPANEQATQRILDIKNRSVEQGLILIASDVEQVRVYADLNSSSLQTQVMDSWPGPTTWVLPCQSETPKWVTGKHASVAMRVTAHTMSSQLCEQFGGAIVSTSANRHGQPALLESELVINEMGAEIDYVIRAKVGDAQQASQIKDSMTGEILR